LVEFNSFTPRIFGWIEYSVALREGNISVTDNLLRALGWIEYSVALREGNVSVTDNLFLIRVKWFNKWKFVTF
jgi:hypothetical protein